MATPPNPLALLDLEASPEALMAARAAALRKQAAQRPATAEEAGALGAIGPGAALSPSVALAEALRNRTPNTGAYELFGGDDEGAVRNRAEGVNLGLGRQRAAGNLGLLTGDKVLSGFGQAQLQGADRQEAMLADAGQFRAGQSLKKALEAEEAKRQAQRDAEMDRHRRVMESRPASNVYLPGPGGQYLLAPSRGAGPVTPLVDPTTGDPLLSPKADDLRLAEEKLKAEAAAKQKADAEKKQQLEVGGFAFADNRLPSADAAKQMKDVAIQSQKIQNDLARLRNLYKEHGTELFGEKAGEMESAFVSITTNLRLMNEMGVPNGRDYEMLAKELADPTTWKDAFTSKGRNLTKLDSLSRRVDTNVAETAKVLGYTPDRQRARVGTRENPAPSNPTPDIDLDAPATAAPEGAGGTVTLYWTTGGSTQTPAARAKKLVSEQPEKYSMTPFPPEKIRKKQYSKKANATRTVDGNGNVISVEEGDTRGR